MHFGERFVAVGDGGYLDVAPAPLVGLVAVVVRRSILDQGGVSAAGFVARALADNRD